MQFKKEGSPKILFSEYEILVKNARYINLLELLFDLASNQTFGTWGHQEKDILYIILLADIS